MSILFLIGLLFCSLSRAANWPVAPTTFALDATNHWEHHFQVNLQTDGKITIEHKKAVNVCFQIGAIPLPLNFTKNTCTFFSFFNVSQASLESSSKQISHLTLQAEHSGEYDIRDLPYTVGVALAYAKDEADSITVSLSGASCASGDVYNGKNCITPKWILNNTKTEEYYSTPGLPQYFKFEVPEVSGTIEFVNEALDMADTPLTFQIRREGTPSKARNDASGPMVKANYLRPGTYFLAAFADAAGETLSFHFKAASCSYSNTTAGPGCAIKVNPAEANMTLVVVDGAYEYFRFVANESRPLFVSVRSVDGKNMPNLYASKGQLPQAGNADISFCNQQYCDFVHSIQLAIPKAAGNETWYVSVSAPSGVVNVTYGIWFDTVCAPKCDVWGECQTKGEEKGYCRCIADYTGVNCSTGNGLGAHYIVLIIIASLVVASAIIGFVAWAYMRRRRPGYDHL